MTPRPTCSRGRPRSARARHRTCPAFNLDLDGLTVESVKVGGRRAAWSRDGAELTVTPKKGIRKHSKFTTVVRYEGIPKTLEDLFGVSGFIHTDDGALVVGEPHVAATWYPVNDHPSDKAAYTFRITVPAGLEAVANGVLKGERTKRGWTTWTWAAKEPTASYLTTATIGEFDLRAYKEAGIRYWDAIDPDLFDPVAEPRTGERFAISQQADSSYKRLSRTISVPAAGATLSFWITVDTEEPWDFVFVEAHTVGADDWTTLPDANGMTSQDTGFSCPFWLGLHPFLEHYQTDNGDGTCSPEGTTGDWWAVTGASGGYVPWLVDLSAYAGSDVEVSISYASDGVVQLPGAFVDDIVVSTGEGTTSFEDDGNPMDGWTVPGAPPGSPGNDNDWIVGTAADTPPPLGAIAEESLALQPEIIDFESGIFGPYPFSAAGGIVDDFPIGFALENQTRPAYSKFFFGRSDLRRLRGRARAGPSVVRRQPDGGTVAPHLAQRGLRHLRRVALVRGPGLRDRAGELRQPLLRDPGGRSVLVRDHRRPGAGAALRLRRIRPRGDDAASAAARGRRRRLLQDPAEVGTVPRG